MRLLLMPLRPQSQALCIFNLAPKGALLKTIKFKFGAHHRFGGSTSGCNCRRRNYSSWSVQHVCMCVCLWRANCKALWIKALHKCSYYPYVIMEPFIITSLLFIHSFHRLIEILLSLLSIKINLLLFKKWFVLFNVWSFWVLLWAFLSCRLSIAPKRTHNILW